MEDGSINSYLNGQIAPLKKDMHFWFWTLTPATLAFLLGSALAWKEGYTFDLSTHGIKVLSQDFKFFLYMAGLSIPFSGLYAAIKRSEETNSQIEITLNQNRFSNYFKHLEELTKFLEKEVSERKINPILTPNQLHKFVYPDYSFTPSLESLSLKNQLHSIFFIIGLKTKDTESKLIKINNAYNKANSIKSFDCYFRSDSDLYNLYLIISSSIEFSPFYKENLLKGSILDSDRFELELHRQIKTDVLNEIIPTMSQLYYYIFLDHFLRNSGSEVVSKEMNDKIKNLSNDDLDELTTFARSRLTESEKVNYIIPIVKYLTDTLMSRGQIND
ncbi:hypothetical protein [Neptunomonas sp.]|uniref:hypothetical protein n=1 Tax=Neptunomonas sp. TaxID=1971898 RepID=UPI003562417F